MEEIFSVLKKYCSWYFKTDQEIWDYIKKHIEAPDGWYHRWHDRKKSANNPVSDFNRGGFILREDNVARILNQVELRRMGSRIIMEAQGTLPAAPKGDWMMDVAHVAKELFPDPKNLHHYRKDFAFYCVINSMVSLYRHKDKPKKPKLTKEEREDLKYARRRAKEEIKALGGGNLELGLEFAALYDIGGLAA